MIELLSEPLAYAYMRNALLVGAMIGALCAFLSVFLMLKGWSLIGDAMSHSIVPGVAGAYILGLPFALGAFFSGALAGFAMLFMTERTGLKVDVIIGIVFTSFFGLGLFMVSVSPTPIDVQEFILGNILAIAPGDVVQITIIFVVSAVILLLKWRDLMVVFFDESHARTLGLRPGLLRVVFFTILAAATVAAMQAVGAFLVIALVVTPGATAYLLSDRFGVVLGLSTLLGTLCAVAGVYLSYFVNGATGGMIVSLQTALFVLAFVFAPKHGILAGRRRAKEAAV